MKANDSTTVKERLAVLWKEVLDVQTSVSGDNFFASGGHSLTATQLIGRIQTEFGVRLSLRDVFEHPTIAGLAAKVETTGTTRPVIPQRRRAKRSGRPYETPLAPAQESFWRVERVLPEAALFNMTAPIEVVGDVEPDALLAALRDLVDRHDVMRATFSERDGLAIQVVQPTFEIPVTRENRHVASARERADAIQEACSAEGRRHFVLAKDIPVRAHLVTFAPDDRVLVIITHHIASDGWSRQLMIGELARLYTSRVRGLPSPPPPDIRFTDFARWQVNRRAEGGFAPSVTFWRELLGGDCVSLRLPGAKDVDSHRTATHPVQVSEDLLRLVSARAREEGVTLFTFLMAAFMGIVSQLCGAPEARAALQVANRELSETQELIGPFANTLMLRVPFAAPSGFREFLHAVQAMALRAYEHQDVPFEHIVAELRRSGDIDPQRLLQIGFALHEDPVREIEVPGGHLRYSPRPRSKAGTEELDATTFELTVEFQQVGESLSGSITYQSGIYDRELIGRFKETYLRAMKAIAEDPGITLAAACATQASDEGR